MTTVRVAVIPGEPSTPPVYLVRPGTVFLEPGDRLRVLNWTGQAVTVSAIGTSPFEVTLPLTITSEGKANLPLVGNPSSGSYAYRITVGAGNIVAHGNSDPVVIVDDP